VRAALRYLLLMPVLLWSASSVADDADSVKHWLPICKTLLGNGPTDLNGAYHAGECLGMIEAAAFIIQKGTPGGPPILACLPDNSISTHQLLTTVLQWIEHDTDLVDTNFLVATQLALAVNWPCHNETNKK
jgi:hypothetical protein